MSTAENITDKTHWEVLLSSIRDSLESTSFNKEVLHETLSKYKSSEEDWQKFVFFDDKRYTRNLVDAGNGMYNLMVLAWNPAQKSCIHDHANSSCFVKILSGAIREIRYETPEEGKKFAIIEDNIRERDETTYMDDSLGVHEMINDTANQTVSLHLYIPPFDTCNLFDRQTAATSICALTFRSLYGELNEPDVEDDPDREDVAGHCC